MDIKEAKPGVKAIWYRTAYAKGVSAKMIPCEVIAPAGKTRCHVWVEGVKRCVGLEQIEKLRLPEVSALPQ